MKPATEENVSRETRETTGGTPVPPLGEGMPPFSNERLLFDCYSATRNAAAMVETIWSVAGRDGVVRSSEAVRPLTDLRAELQRALCAAQELENRSKRMEPAKRG